LKEYQQLNLAIFHEPCNQRLRIPEGVEPEQWATHLAYISAREPNNLVNHVRRVYLHLAQSQSDPLYGAMLDLYLALGEKGIHLRQRLLRKSKKLLSKERLDLFLTHYEQGLKKNQPVPFSKYSVLGNFFYGKKKLTREQTRGNATGNRRIDPLELAQEELNFGDIGVAQQILEEALLEAPHRMGLHYGLLEIYKHTRVLDDLLNMQERLGEGVSVAQTAWKQTRKLLESKGS
jgi:hypothetical protein